MLHLQPLLQRGVNKLSGGERQRVALGRAILSQPRLILLDEPLSGLDGSLKYQIIPYLQRAFERCNLPFIFISHSLEELRLMTDEVMSMNNGATGEPMSTETLARSRVGNDIEEYDNLLELREPARVRQFSQVSLGANRGDCLAYYTGHRRHLPPEQPRHSTVQETSGSGQRPQHALVHGARHERLGLAVNHRA
jgi:ABC-type sugar transport system ATPase subunit